MKVFQLIKRVGGFCRIHSLHHSSVPPRYAPTRTSTALLLANFHPAFAPAYVTKAHILSLSPFAAPSLAFFSSSTALQQSAMPSSSQTTSSITSSPLQFDQTVLNSYETAMTDVFQKFPTDRKPTKKVSNDEFQQVQQFLLSDQYYHHGTPLDLDDGSNLRKVLQERRKHVMQANNLTDHQFELAMRCMATMASNCAKSSSVLPVTVAWAKIKDTGMILRPNFISTFLYVMGLEEEYTATAFEIATFHDSLYGSTENSIYLRIKALVTMGDAEAAEKLLESLPAEKEECKRLRSFIPIIKHYCDKGEAHSILRVFKQMKDAQGVHFDSETYALIIGSLARNGCLSSNAEPIVGATEIGFTHSCGPKLLDEIMTDVADDIIEISEEAASMLCREFLAGSSSGTSDTITAGNTERGLPGAPRCSKNALHESDRAVGRVTIESTTGLCPSTGARLRQLTLTKEQRHHVCETLLEMAATQQKDYVGAKYQNRTKYKFSQAAEEELKRFAEWLQDREGSPFTAFVDGANVAYFGQGTVRYSQVVRVVEELEKMGEKPLVIMPRKYVNASFRVANGQTQKLGQKDLEAITELVSECKLYIVPAQCFDDYYWMLASVSAQSGSTLEVSPAEDTVSFPGIRPMLISNDQMRDHKLELLEPRLFRRWYSSQVVTYTISPYEGDEWSNRTVNFTPADFFSREIQGNSFDNDGRVGRAWHLPVSGWEPRSDRLCIAVSEQE